MIECHTDLSIAGRVSETFFDEIRQVDPSAGMEYQGVKEELFAQLDEGADLAIIFETIGAQKVGKLVVFGNSEEALRQMEEVCVRHQVAFVSRIEPMEGRSNNVIAELRIFAPEHEDDLGEVLRIPASIKTIDISFLRELMDKKGPQQVARMLSYAANPEQALPPVIMAAPGILNSLSSDAQAPAI